MHVCLHVQEILNLIFGHLYDNLQAKALARVARTCRTFADPALDLLWKDQQALGPLVQCMPSDLWAYGPQEQENGEEGKYYKIVNFTRPLEEGDWIRVAYYGPKIWRLGFSQFHIPVPQVDPSVLIALSAYRPIQKLLSNLVEFRFNLDIPSVVRCIPYMQGILEPSITHVHVTTTIGTVKHLNYLTSSIIRNCPNIQELVLTPNLLVIETHCPPAFYRLISGCMQLRNVSISGASALPVAIVKHLRGLPNLMSLMGMGIKTLSDIDLFTTEDGGFSNLHTFGFISQSWTISASMIESMDCPFKFLRVICRLSRESPTALSMFTNVLNRHRSASSLTVLVLCGIVHADQQTASEVLRPLFSLRALRDIALIFSFIHVLGDDWLEEAALSWPSLRYLSLALRERTSVEVLRLKIPQMTLAGLLPLIKYCPHLHHICLSLDATQIRPSPLLGVSNPIIDKLWLCSSPIITPEKVFRALVTMFPRLKKVVVYGAVEEDGWSKVNDLLNISAFDIAEESS